MIDRVLRVAMLYDFYGALLTVKQRRCLDMHYLDDLSLSEIADEFCVSRQAIHDILRRAEQTLEEYEVKIGLAQKYQHQKNIIKEVHNLIEEAALDSKQQTPKLELALNKIKHLLD